VGLVFCLQVMGVPAGGEAGYTIVAGSEDGCFFPGRAATVMWKGRVVGSFGVVHPEGLDRIGLSNPASVMEVDLQPFVNL
jgi:phenylalanyl-tRNA synthetase beta chain